ncbi:MAG: BrnA antitoxin family protein [Bryobacteraceae bacterium]
MSKRSTIKSDLARVDRLKDTEINYSDIPPLDTSFFTQEAEPWPPVKRQLTVRLDADVLDWLKATGRGYQTRLNRILRIAMESQSSPAVRRQQRKG